MDEITVQPLRAEEKAPAPEAKDAKNVLYMAGALLVILVVTLGAVSLYDKDDKVTGATTSNGASIQELHEQNAAGQLKASKGYGYNGYSFVRYEGLWWTQLNRLDTWVNIPLHYGPRDLEDIPIIGTIDPAFNEGEEVFIAIDPKVQDKYYTLGLSELSLNIAKGIKRKPVGSCATQDPACVDREILNCKNTQGKPIIELVQADKAQIELIGTCMKVSGSGYDSIRSVDRALLHWYKVMP